MLNRFIKAGLDPTNTAVSDVMTPNPVCLDGKEHGIECIRVMRDECPSSKHLGRLSL